MDANIRDRWVAALRSGRYLQASQVLATPPEANGTSGYCCLGVLCDLAVQAGAIPPAETPLPADVDGLWFGVHDGPSTIGGNSSQTVLPRPVLRWAGLQESDPDVDGKTLSARNDAGVSFDEIADLIERSL